MELKTKFNIGDLGYFMEKQIPVKAKIIGISVITGIYREPNGTTIEIKDGECAATYHFDNFGRAVEENIYSSKKELIKAVFDKLD